MSQYRTIGTNPKNEETVNFVYGWDHIPLFDSGYFVQVSDNSNDDTFIETHGNLNGITLKELKVVAKKYNVNLKPIVKQLTTEICHDKKKT